MLNQIQLKCGTTKRSKEDDDEGEKWNSKNVVCCPIMQWKKVLRIDYISCLHNDALSIFFALKCYKDLNQKWDPDEYFCADYYF